MRLSYEPELWLLMSLLSIPVAQKFHELNTAYELLLDPTRRTALDTKLKAQQAKKLRFASYDNKRKVMMEELEKSEREFKKSRLDAHHEAQRRQQEEEMIKEEGRRLMREKQEAMSKLAEEKGKQKAKEEAPSEAPSGRSFTTTGNRCRSTLIFALPPSTYSWTPGYDDTTQILSSNLPQPYHFGEHRSVAETLWTPR